MSTTSTGPDAPKADGQPSDVPPSPESAGCAEAQGTPLAAREAYSRIEALQIEVVDLKDRLLRAHAEMDNIRKRTDREKSEAHKYAVSKFAHDIVTVGDNFQRAINTIPPGAVEETPVLKSFLDGVMLTERELLNALERHGITRIDPNGEPFNPHQHQAVVEAHNPDVPSGTVVQVFQLGYMIEDRVLRPAMVAVAKGGARPGQPAVPHGDQANETSADAEDPSRA